MSEVARSRSSRLAYRFVVVTVALLSVALSAAGVILISLAWGSQLEHYSGIERKSSEQVTAAISDYIEHAVRMLEVFEGATLRKAPDLDAVEAAMHDFLLWAQPLFGQILLFDSNGDVAARYSRFHTYLESERQDAPEMRLSFAVDGSYNLSTVYISKDSGLLSTAIAIPARHKDAPGATLQAELNASELWQKVGDVKIGRTGYAYLVDGTGHFVAYQDASEVLRRHGENLSALRSVADFVNDDGSDIGALRSYRGLKGETVQGLYHRVAGTPWATIVEIPLAEIEADTRGMYGLLVLIWGFSVVVSAIACYLITMRIVHPIKALTDAALRLGSGDMGELALDVGRTDEVGILAKAFAAMQDSLRKLYGDLETQLKELKGAQGALAVSELHYRTLFDFMPIGLFKSSLDGEILDANIAMARILGCASVGEAVARPVLDFYLVPADRERMIENLRATSELPSLEMRMRRLDGQSVWVRLNMYLVNDDRKGGSYIEGSIEDIGELKKTEKDRESLIKELETKNAELSRFAYTVSHDLKSPIVTIKGFLSYLEKEARAGDFERLHADIERISNASDKMQNLLRELLELSRIGRLKNESTRVPFNAIVDEAVTLIEGRLRETGASLEIEKGMPVVCCDMVRMVEVLQNLLDNALKYMGPQENPRVVVGTERRGDETVFFVRDNGIGVDERYAKRVFELFEKLDRDTDGTGIGLAIVKRVIEVHSGRIWLESEGPGKGTAFLFTLGADRDANGETEKRDEG